MCIQLKIYIIIFDSFCVFLLEHFEFYLCFYCCLPCLTWFFANIQNFHFQIKQKISFLEVKILGGFTILAIHFKIHFQIIHFIRNYPQFLQELLPSSSLVFLTFLTLQLANSALNSLDITQVLFYQMRRLSSELFLANLTTQHFISSTRAQVRYLKNLSVTRR